MAHHRFPSTCVHSSLQGNSMVWWEFPESLSLSITDIKMWIPLKTIYSLSRSLKVCPMHNSPSEMICPTLLSKTISHLRSLIKMLLNHSVSNWRLGHSVVSLRKRNIWCRWPRPWARRETITWSPPAIKALRWTQRSQPAFLVLPGSRKTPTKWWLTTQLSRTLTWNSYLTITSTGLALSIHSTIQSLKEIAHLTQRQSALLRPSPWLKTPTTASMTLLNWKNSRSPPSNRERNSIRDRF